MRISILVSASRDDIEAGDAKSSYRWVPGKIPEYRMYDLPFIEPIPTPGSARTSGSESWLTSQQNDLGAVWVGDNYGVSCLSPPPPLPPTRSGRRQLLSLGRNLAYVLYCSVIALEYSKLY